MESSGHNKNHNRSQNQSQIDNLVTKTIRVLKRDYIVVGKKQVQVWKLGVFLGIVAGLMSGVILVANRSGEFVPTDAALAGAISVTIQANQSLGSFRPLQGFLHGITYQSGVGGIDYSKTINMIDALKPQNWRLSNFLNNVYGFVVTNANYPGRFGTKIVFNVSDAFINSKNNSFVKLDSSCPPGNFIDNCFATFDEMKTEWAKFIEAMMQSMLSQNLAIHYLDIFNEPNSGVQVRGLSGEHFLELFRIAHSVIRFHQPMAKIVAPSISDYNKAALEGFLSYIEANNLRLDALSWHEFNWSDLNTISPEIIPIHVKEMRAFFAAHPKLCNPICPEFHINEYAGEQHFVPGWVVGWLHYLGKGQADVDVANRACWDASSDGVTQWSNCWAGINGMLMDDNITPQAIYWVHKFYADLLGSIQLKTISTDSKTIAISGKMNSSKTLMVLVGRYGGDSRSSTDVELKITGYPYSASGTTSKVKLQWWRVPKPTHSAQPLLSPIQLTTMTKKVNALKTVSIFIPNFVDGDAYLLVITPL